MSITALLYGKHFLSLYAKTIDYLNDAIKVRLHTSLYVPDQDVDQYVSNLTNEVGASGTYATGAGNSALANKTITYTGATNIVMLDADDISWTGATITARVATIYDGTPATDATRPLFGYQLSTTDIISTNGTFQIVWNASGIVQITVS